MNWKNEKKIINDNAKKSEKKKYILLQRQKKNLP